MPLLTDGLHSLLHFSLSGAFGIHILPATSSTPSFHLFLGLPLALLPSLRVHSNIFLAHLLFIRARCPAHCPLISLTLSVISFTLVFALVASFLILSLQVTLSIALSMLLWATASFLSYRFVRVHVSAL